MDEFYFPHQIIYERQQNIWLIFHLELMIIGDWPTEPDEYIGCVLVKDGHRTVVYRYKKYKSSYFEMPFGIAGIKPSAYFEMACLIGADIEMRLGLTGLDGKDLIKQIRDNEGITFNYIEGNARQALDYISVFDFRKRPTYIEWVGGERIKRIMESSLCQLKITLGSRQNVISDTNLTKT